MARNESVSVEAPVGSGDFIPAPPGGAAEIMRRYRLPLIALGLVVLALLVAMPFNRYRRATAAMELAADMRAAAKSLKKEDIYRGILAEHASLPAAQIARLRLAQHLADHQEPDKGVAVLDEYVPPQSPDILSTFIVLKKADILKAQGRRKESADALSAAEARVIPAWRARLMLMRADLLMDAGLKDEGRAVLQSVAGIGVGTAEEALGGFDPEPVEEAKERLLLMDLGLL